jgi:Fur family transcriptional regulator, iron response regulator
MTERKTSPQCLSPKEIEDRLLKAKIQPTAQRIAICQYVLCEADHPTADEVKAWADNNFPKMSLATVYNTLKTLVEGGLLREYRFPHSDKVIYDNNLNEHYHFVDEKTGELVDISPEEIAPNGVNLSSKHYEIHSVDVVFRGTRKKSG